MRTWNILECEQPSGRLVPCAAAGDLESLVRTRGDRAGRSKALRQFDTGAAKAFVKPR